MITEWFGWRWAFLVNLPIGIVLLAATALVLVESRDNEAKRLDIGGIVSFSGGFFLPIWASIDGNVIGWKTPTIEFRLIGAVGNLRHFYLHRTPS